MAQLYIFFLNIICINCRIIIHQWPNIKETNQQVAWWSKTLFSPTNDIWQRHNTESLWLSPSSLSKFSCVFLDSKESRNNKGKEKKTHIHGCSCVFLSRVKEKRKKKEGENHIHGSSKIKKMLSFSVNPFFNLSYSVFFFTFCLHKAL